MNFNFTTGMWLNPSLNDETARTGFLCSGGFSQAIFNLCFAAIHGLPAGQSVLPKSYT